MIKLLDFKSDCTSTIKVKFIRNTEFPDITNNSSEPLIFSNDEALAMVDLRSIGYYKLKQSIICSHFKNYYEFKPLQMLCEEFHKLTNTLKRVEQQSTGLNPWLAKVDERRNLTERYW